jgi:hypothetical protein
MMGAQCWLDTEERGAQGPLPGTEATNVQPVKGGWGHVLSPPGWGKPFVHLHKY